MPAQYRKIWVRESWRSVSRSQDGSESPAQCVLYSTTMTSPRPRTDWWPVIFSISRRSRAAETLSCLTWYGGDFLKKLLSTYWVNPADRYLGISLRSWGLSQGLQRSIATRPRASEQGRSEGRSN